MTADEPTADRPTADGPIAADQPTPADGPADQPIVGGPAAAAEAPGPRPPTPPPWDGAGRSIVQVDAVGTALLLVVTVAASVAENGATDLANLVVSGVLFLGGCGAFAMGFVRAAGRSRSEVVDLAGLFYLTGSAPREPRRLLLGLWFAQIGIATASVVAVEPPFGVMAPVWGIGLLTLWGARHGTFPARGRT